MGDTPAERGGAGLWAGMRRRKVVQWGLVYVAAAWAFLQGLEYVGESFHWPEQLRQIAIIALLVALPIVLVLAWYHGDRGQQRITTSEFAILTVLLLLGGGAFWYYERASEAGKDAVPTASAVQPVASSAVTDPRPSIAVLPFDNRSKLEDDAFFVDGIHDDILTQLSKISALRVISRASVERFRRSDLSIREIAQQLGVSSILEGGVQRAGDRVRINVQLIDAATDANAWAESYDRELTTANLFAIQEEVATAIAIALKASLTTGEKARVAAVPTRNLDAWQDYQLGIQRRERRTKESLDAAESFLRRAIHTDQAFSLAYAALADTLILKNWYTDTPWPAVSAQVQANATKALELDPGLGEAIISLAGWADAEGLTQRAETDYRRGLELSPNYAHGLHWYSDFLLRQGRTDEALQYEMSAVELDPLSANTRASLGDVHASLGNFADAMKAYKRAIEIDPSMPVTYVGLGDLLGYAYGRIGAAVAAYEKAMLLDPKSKGAIGSLANAYLDLGDEERANELIRLNPSGGSWLDLVRAMAALYAGDRAAADAYARKSLTAANYGGPSAYAVLLLATAKPAMSRSLLTARCPRLAAVPVSVDRACYRAAIDLAWLLQVSRETDQANELLTRGEAVIRTVPRNGWAGFGLSDVRIQALRGNSALALTALQQAARDGWRGPFWRYHRDFDPALASIRNEPAFKAVFADIERDMSKQRAALAVRPKDAPIDVAVNGQED